MKVGFSLTGQEKTHVRCMGQVNFDLRQIKIEVWLSSHTISFPDRTGVAQTLGTRLVTQWAIDHVTLSESVSLVNDNFQTETISKLKTAR